MRSSKNLLMTAAIVIFAAALGWRFGYSAAAHGERQDIGGAIFVALQLTVLVGIAEGLMAVWRMATAAGAGISPLRHIVFALGVVATGFVLIACLTPLAMAGDSFSLGIVIFVIGFVLWYELKRGGGSSGPIAEAASHDHEGAEIY